MGYPVVNKDLDSSPVGSRFFSPPSTLGMAWTGQKKRERRQLAQWHKCGELSYLIKPHQQQDECPSTDQLGGRVQEGPRCLTCCRERLYVRELRNVDATTAYHCAVVYADWCAPCRQIAPHYASLSAKFSKPGEVSFCKVNVDQQKEVASAQRITAMPTFIVFRDGAVAYRVRGADPRALAAAVEWGIDPEAAAAKGLQEPKAESESQSALSGMFPLLFAVFVWWLASNFPTQAVKDFLFSRGDNS
jgi:thiol-disulfide isomerase/thioredoxin